MNIEIKNFYLSYKDNQVFTDFNLEIESGKITSLLGNSGTGKSSLLNAISGLVDYQGEIKNVPADISYIFQNQALIPNLTVYENIEYVLKHRYPKDERKDIITQILSLVELLDSKDRYPRELSTGMAQRVSMARAFVFPSSLILMDEPFRGLDIGLKSKLLSYFIKLWEREKRTVIFVTHSIDEALLLSDKILVIGHKPAKVIDSFDINSKQFSRNMSDTMLTTLYNSIYESFIVD